MGALATAVANKTLDHLNLTAAYTPTGPLKLRLMTVNGSAAAAGIEVTGGTYASQTIEFAAASGGARPTTPTSSSPACPQPR
jgi:hypothetical protein